MKSFHLLLAASAVVCAAVPVAHADSFSFSFGAPGTTYVSGSGTLIASQNADGSYLVTSATGTTDDGDGVAQMIESLEQPGNYEMNDNLLFSDGAGGYTFDYVGLSYMLSDGAQVNLIANLAEEILISGAAGENGYAEPITITANTPEPGSLVLLGTGLLGGVGVVRRRLSA